MWVVSVFFVYRAIILLHEDKGPFRIFERIRDWLDSKPDSQLTELYSCPSCVSIWLSIFPASYVSANIWEFPLYLLAISGGAMLVKFIVQLLE